MVQSTIRLGRYGWNTSKEVSLRRKTKKEKNKVEEIQLAKLVNQSVAWYACEASLGKEKYVRLNEWNTKECLLNMHP